MSPWYFFCIVVYLLYCIKSKIFQFLSVAPLLLLGAHSPSCVQQCYFSSVWSEIMVMLGVAPCMPNKITANPIKWDTDSTLIYNVYGWTITSPGFTLGYLVYVIIPMVLWIVFCWKIKRILNFNLWKGGWPRGLWPPRMSSDNNWYTKKTQVHI